MSFINTLLKGFVRSAVNQVGRDGGKVISNQLYGNTHAAPVRVSQNQTQTETIHLETTSNNIAPQNTNTPTYSFLSMAFADYLFFKIIAYASLCFTFIGAIYVILRGSEYSKEKQMPIYETKTIAVGVPDKRYKSGARITGYKERTVITGYAPADYNHLKYYTTKGTIYKTIGWVYLATSVIIAIGMYTN